MSGTTGDKARYGRLRKLKLARRIRTRELTKAHAKPAVAAAAPAPPAGEAAN